MLLGFRRFPRDLLGISDKFSPSGFRPGCGQSCLMAWRDSRIESGRVGFAVYPLLQVACGPALFHPERDRAQPPSRGLWSHVTSLRQILVQ